MTETAAFATADDLEAGWRVLSEVEKAKATVLLERASRMVRRRFPSIDGRIATGEITPDDLSDIVVAMVKNAMVGPEIPVTSETHTTGPFSRSVQFSNPTGELYFSKWMLEALEPVGRRVVNGWLA